MKDIKFRLWDDRYLLLNYDSFQSMWLMYNYLVDWEEFNLISRYVQDENVVFDIGANMGYYTIWMSKFLRKGSIHAFEPDTLNFGKLQRNIALNNLQDVVIPVQKAVSDIDGKIYFTKELDIENHIVPDNTGEAISVVSQKIDCYAEQNNISQIAYMKIDVEGFEFAVLKGAAKMLAEKRIDIVQLEINKSIANSGKCIEDLLELLNAYQYTLCSYDVPANQLIKTEFSGRRENYFAVNNIEKINKKLLHSNFAEGSAIS